MGTIAAIHEKLVSKQVSCTELTKAYLKEIENANGELNAYVCVTPDEALQTAAAVDKKIAAGEALGLLEGVPMTLKDNMSTKGIDTTCCSKILTGYKPIFDATVWELLKAQNAVMLGKTNMDEFAMGSSCENSCFGGAMNPFDVNHVAGGSSGGVASAVGGNIAAYGLGSDTGGSIRQPASFCGVVGLKPTYGAVSRYGLIAYASSLDQIGPITKSVEDASIVFDAIAKQDKRDSTSLGAVGGETYSKLTNDIKGMKIGIMADVITVNPPYFLENSGKVNRNENLKTARHTEQFSHSILFEKAYRLLRDKGKLFLIQRAQNLCEILTNLREHRLEPKRLRLVYGAMNKDANLFMVEAVKNGGIWMDCLPPLVLYDENGEMTEEFRLMQEF